MYSRRTYANPPLIEALCELRFEPGRPWDQTIPGLLYADVRESFPIREQEDQTEIQFRLDSQRVQRQTTKRMRFFNSGKTALIQVSPDALVINHLQPYPGWEVFRSKILTALDRYKAVAEPKAVSACALRYINRIPVPSEGAILEHYLVTVPNVPKNLPEALVGWALSLDIPHLERKGIVRLEAGAAPVAEGEDAAFVLDIRFSALAPQDLGLEDSLTAWIDGAHDVVQETFEASITSDARLMFQEEE